MLPDFERKRHQFIVTDFEMAAMQAVTAVSGQQALYNADIVAKHFGIVATGRDGTSSCQHPQHLDDMIDYFDPTYVTGRHCVVQHPAANDAAPLPPTRLRRQTTTNDPVRPRRMERPHRHRHWVGQDEQHVRVLELGIPATRRPPAPRGLDAAEVSPEGRGSRIHTDSTGESWDAAEQAPEAHLCRPAGAPQIDVRRPRSRDEVSRGLVGRCRSPHLILDCRFNCVQLRTIWNCIIWIINWCSEMTWLTRLK